MASAKPATMRKRGDFLRVQQTGIKFRGRHVLLIAGRVGDDDALTRRIGLTVSRRVGGAVVRNKVKRRLREIWRAQIEAASMPVDVVIVALPAAAGAPFVHLREDVAWLLRKALGRVSPAPSSIFTSACSRP